MPGGRANAQGEVRLYAGEPLGNGVSALPWGSGEARQSEEHVLMGSNSLKIVTHGRYQGARLVLTNPLSVKSMMANPSAYLQFLVVLPNKETIGRMGTDYGMMGGRGGMGKMGAMMGGRGGQSGRMGGRQGQGGDGSSGTSSQLVKPKPLSGLRLVIRTTDGKRAETVLPLDTSVRIRDDWSSLSVPLVTLSSLKDSNGEIKEIDIFGDSPATLYLGEARVIRDDTPIRVDDLAEKTVPVNDDVPFSASADAGVSPVRYEWDFNSGDGVDVDAEGRTVKHKFRKSLKDSNGNTLPYIVTLRVVDPYGLKKPVVKTTKVYVTL
jgi:hypothetical protein